MESIWARKAVFCVSLAATAGYLLAIEFKIEISLVKNLWVSVSVLYFVYLQVYLHVYTVQAQIYH